MTPEQIDAILPQTQCGLCGYGGCMPYARALVQEDAAINLCPPGGVRVLHKIADLVGKNALPYVQEMEQKAKPALLAVIREAECIGCAKCIQACPVDAILGSAKQMHSVLTDECTGCELCVAPCPVDCIDMLVVGERDLPSANLARERFQAREKRLSLEEAERVLAKQQGRSDVQSQDEKKSYVQAAILRARLKKGLQD